MTKKTSPTAQKTSEKNSEKISPAAQKVAVENLSKISQHGAEVDISSSDNIREIFEQYLNFKRESLKYSESQCEREKINEEVDQAYNKANENILEINRSNSESRKNVIIAIIGITAATVAGIAVFYSNNNKKS